MAVLDTNVVLDWLVFRNPGVRLLAEALEAGTVRWLMCAEMRAELDHVLAHARLAGAEHDRASVLAAVDRLAHPRALTTGLPLTRARCSDPSDQMFVDLALAQQARWLLTRDRALLKLARKLAPAGVLVQLPDAWQPDQARITSD